MAAYVAVFITLAAVIAGILVWQTNELITRQVLATIAAEADGLKAVAHGQGPEALAVAIAERSKSARDQLYYLAGPDGRKIAGNLNRWPPELKDRRGGLFRYAAGPVPDASERVAVGVPIALQGGERLLLARDVEEQIHFIRHVRNVFLAGFGMLVVIGLAGGVAASRLILNRIASITATSESIMAGDMSRRIALSGSGDELDELARRLNAMLDRIEQLMAGLREVSDNIAHDLKTPLNRLRNRTEAALRDGRSAEDYREGLSRALEEADEIIKTFNALLLIARLEAGAVEETLEEFDATALVRDAVELYEPLAEESRTHLKLASETSVIVKANRQLIGQAVANLIDNAIKYAGTSTCAAELRNFPDITVTVARQDDWVEIAVADRGPGIPASDRERVLKRFVRLEASRTRPGTGLGLSLVAAVARLHKGTVRLEDNEPGLRVVLSWPVAPVL
jgi:signal transduction histidine kinase